jgi:branched-chain amino acid aminotransferase
MNSRYVWMNGALLPAERATLPFLTSALHYGSAVFEGIRAYRSERGPAVFRLREHAERLLDSARIFGLPELRWSVADVSDAIVLTVQANGFDECYIRPVVYVSGGGWNLSNVGVETTLAVGVWEWTTFFGTEVKEKGVRANVSSFTRHHPNVMMTKAKISGNYANSILAKTESQRLGFDEAIMLDPSGFVAECTGENLFVVRADEILTPASATVLEGLTRDALITIARDLGYTVREAPISRDQLYRADEVFVCGTAAEVVALREIDFRPIGAGRMGPVTAALQRAFEAAVHGREPRYESWLTRVKRNGAAEAARPAASS